MPMALRVGVLRQFRETEGLRFDVRRASGNNALVIGNPPSPGAADPPGAAAEECMAAAERPGEARLRRGVADLDDAGRSSADDAPAVPTGTTHRLDRLCTPC